MRERLPGAFDIPAAVTSGQLLARLSERFTTRSSPARRLRLRYYDTYDWRLYAEGLVLVRVADEYRLRRLDDDTPLESCRSLEDLVFWWDYPHGPLRERLRRTLEERAALPLGEVVLRTRNVSVLNADEKVVVRARVDEGSAADGRTGSATIRLVNVLPVRGYRRDARRLARALADAGAAPASRTTFEEAVRMCGREPGDYSSKLRLSLDRSMTSQQAAGVIFARLADTMERNVPGIRGDVDTEFLHDFRVAVRRTRSGLTQIKGILPAEVAGRFRARLADLGRATNRLRDLDVYLLERGRYAGMLSEDLRPALDPMFEAYAAERRVEHASVSSLLAGDDYRGLVREWGETLGQFGSAGLEGKRSSLPVEKEARRFIRRRFTKVAAMGTRIDDTSPDGDLHALRIECKKLRYLLEFFASLYPPRDIEAFVKQLKQLQDNLGEFNDLSVQQEELRRYLHKTRPRVSVETAAAVGALIAKLEDRQRVVRRRFTRAFAASAGPENRRRFEALFGSS